MYLRPRWSLLLAAIVAVAGFGAEAADEREALFNRLQALIAASPNQAPDDVSMVYVPAGSDSQKTNEMVKGALAGAAKTKKPVAILGPDGALLLDVVTRATIDCQRHALRGVTVFYLGREGDDSELTRLRSKCGAHLVFGTYP